MPRWVWIALGTALALVLAGAGGWALRDGRARQRESAARERAFRDSVALATASHRQDSISAVTRDSIRRERERLALIIAQAEAAGASLASSAAALTQQAVVLHVKLDSARSAADSARLLLGEVGALAASNRNLTLAVDTLTGANRGLHHQLALDTLDRRNDATQHTAQLAAAGGVAAKLREDLLAAQDTIRKLKGKGYLFGLRFLPKPELIVGYGIHGEAARQSCTGALARLPAGTIDVAATCAGEPRWRLAKGFHATLGFHLPL